MKLNLYGFIGVLFIACMAVSVAYHWGQADSWNIFVFASLSLIFYCFGLLLYFNSIHDERFLIGCHLALIFLIIGTWLPPAHNDAILFPDQYTGKGSSESTLFLAIYFFGLLAGWYRVFISATTSI